MFGEKIGRVLGSGNLRQRQISSLQPVLDPQVGHMQVSYLSQAASSADADCGRSISEEMDFQRNPQVMCERLQSQSNRCATAYPTQLGLSGGERDCRLSDRPMFQWMPTAHGYSTGGGPACSLASPQIHIHIHIHGVSHWLKREIPNQSRHSDQEPRCALQCLDASASRVGEIPTQFFGGVCNLRSIHAEIQNSSRQGSI